MILLYANEYEVRYVTYKPRYFIGLGAKVLGHRELLIRRADQVILFGCSGWRGKRKVARFNRLYEWSINSYALVDMESQQVYEMCKKYNVPFKSIRYIIDLDRGRVMPWGINHFWRIYQHRRMQLKFNKYSRDEWPN